MTRPTAARRILWQNVLTVVSAAILIGAEVFGAAFAGSWAIANLLALGTIGAHAARRALRALRHRRHGAVRARRAARRAVHGDGLSACRRRSRDDAQKISAPYVLLKSKIACTARAEWLICGMPNFARACGRVSVGGHPDKRPDSRLRKRTATSLLPRPAAGGETGAPRSPRGTRLKATTERAFLVTAGANAGDTEKACPSLPAVRNGISLIRTKAAITAM